MVERELILANDMPCTKFKQYVAARTRRRRDGYRTTKDGVVVGICKRCD